MTVSARIYAGGAFAAGGDPALSTLKSAGYDTLLMWSVHVAANGDLALNNDPIITGGKWAAPDSWDLANRLATLHKSGISVGFSVGSGGVPDFTHIETLLGGGVPGKGNALYDNFALLKSTMQAAGGDVDFIDFDWEYYYNNPVKDPVSTLSNFAIMLGDVGYGSVSFCPYTDQSTWQSAYEAIGTSKYGIGFVSAIHLQVYSGGGGNIPNDWGKMIHDVGGSALLIPGLESWQAYSGPWWDGSTKAMGQTVQKVANVAQYEGSDYGDMIARGNYASVEDALKAAGSQANYMFYCRESMLLTNGMSFQPGDTVFFQGTPWWGSAPQADGYALSGPVTIDANGQSYDLGGCPGDMKSQFATWKGNQYPPQGGFVWLYDSVVSTLLTAQCGGTEKDPATTAADYAADIKAGLS